MKHRDDEELRRALQAADPAGGEDLAGWADSEDGRRVYARIAELRTQERRGLRRPSRRAFRLVLAAVGAVVLVAAVVTAAVLATRGSSPQLAEEAVDPVTALTAVVDMAEAIQGSNVTESPVAPADDPLSYAQRAESLGISLPAERGELLDSPSVTRGDYARWLWRAFGSLLGSARHVDYDDLGSLDEETREAVIGIAQAGVLDGRSASLFAPDEPLTREEEQEAVARLERLLGLRED